MNYLNDEYEGYGAAFREKKYDAMLAAGRRVWTPTELPDLTAYLQKEKKSLDLILLAAARPKWWTPLVSGDGRSMDSAPMVGEIPGLRELDNLIGARATCRAGMGDFDGFLADLLAVKRVARHMSSRSGLEYDVGLEMDACADRAIGAVAARGILTAAQCATLSNALREMKTIERAAEIVNIWERWSTLDEVALIATGRAKLLGATDSVGGKFATIDRAAVDWDTVLRGVNATFDKELQLMSRPDAPVDKAAEAASLLRMQRAAAQSLAKQSTETRAQYTARITRAIGGPWDITLLFAMQRQGHLIGDMTRLVVAVAAQKAMTGHWPAKAENLLSAHLPTMPLDMAGMPVKYTVTPNGITVSGTGERGRLVSVGN